jgi:hypothetical protein
MSHLDEGTLHALLDGELDLAEVSEIQIHLGTCVACGSRLQEVKQVLAEADRLVGAVEMPAGAGRARPQPPRATAPRPTREPDVWDEAPVLLLPEAGDAGAQRARWMKRLRWAAAIVVVVGVSKMITGPGRPYDPEVTDRDLTSASPTVPPPVVSPQERRRPDSPLVVARGKSGRTSQARAPVAKTAVKPESAASEQTLAATAGTLVDSASLSAEDTASPDSELLATRNEADSANQPSPAQAVASDSVAAARDRKDSESQPPEPDELATRRAAAQALEELDRDRRRERANAATAALPPARPVQPTAEPAPAPRTLEQRAQIYLRIGLDEAVKQLGGPAHVIEGMTPQFIGLTRGQLVPGADAQRPVVRVVYLDSRGRMILLDQQRMEPGQAPGGPAGNLRWTIGDVMVYLRGEPTPDVLRSLQARVR